MSMSDEDARACATEYDSRMNGETFDRWLAERVRLAQEQAWNEGYEAADLIQTGPNRYTFNTVTNPYTQGDKQA